MRGPDEPDPVALAEAPVGGYVDGAGKARVAEDHVRDEDLGMDMPVPFRSAPLKVVRLLGRPYGNSQLNFTSVFDQSPTPPRYLGW